MHLPTNLNKLLTSSTMCLSLKYASCGGNLSSRIKRSI